MPCYNSKLFWTEALVLASLHTSVSQVDCIVICRGSYVGCRVPNIWNEEKGLQDNHYSGNWKKNVSPQNEHPKTTKRVGNKEPIVKLYMNNLCIYRIRGVNSIENPARHIPEPTIFYRHHFVCEMLHLGSHNAFYQRHLIFMIIVICHKCITFSYHLNLI